MGINKFAKLLRFASSYYRFVKMANLRDNLATRIMYSAIPAIKAKEIEERYAGKNDEASLKQKEREISKIHKDVVEKLSPTILSGAIELLKFAKEIIYDEFKSYGDIVLYGVPDEESKKVQEQLKSLFDSGDTQEACRLAEDKFLEEGKWATAYGGKPWADFAKHIGLLDKELGEVNELEKKRAEMIGQRHQGDEDEEGGRAGGIATWQGSSLEKDFFNACIKISQRVNFIDSLQHNTGSFFSKMIRLDPSISQRRYERNMYERTMDELSDAKELKDNEHVLEILAPYTSGMPDTLKAYMPKGVGPRSEGAEHNLMLVRFDRTVGMTFDKALKTIRDLKISMQNLTKWQLESLKSELKNLEDLLSCIRAIGTVSQLPPEIIKIKRFEYPPFSRNGPSIPLSRPDIKNDMLKQIQTAMIDKLKDSGITVEAVENRLSELEKEEHSRRMSRQTLQGTPTPPKPPVPKGPKPPLPPSMNPLHPWPAKPLQGYDDAFPSPPAFEEDDKKIA